MCHRLLNYVFLLFWSIFREIQWKILFLVQKMAISERISDILRTFLFLNKIGKVQILRKIRICFKHPFCSSSKIGQIKKQLFSPQNEPHRFKLCVCVFFLPFGGNSLKMSLFSQKMTISEKRSEILRRFVFLNKFEKGKIQRKIRICYKQPFLFKAVKLDKYERKLFFSSKWDTYC